jgi:hypothetical protein
LGRAIVRLFSAAVTGLVSAPDRAISRRLGRGVKLKSSLK